MPCKEIKITKIEISASGPTDSHKYALTLQRGEMGDARHSENEACRGKTSDDRHAARSHSLHYISTTSTANVIGLVWPY
jgi:hypothetical protein